MTRLVIVKDLPDAATIHERLEPVRAAIDVESRWRVFRQQTHPDDMVVDFRGITGPRVDHQNFLGSDLAKSRHNVHFGNSGTTDVNEIARFLKDLGKVYDGERTLDSRQRLLAVDPRGYVAEVDIPLLPYMPAQVAVSRFIPESPVGEELLPLGGREVTFANLNQSAVRVTMVETLPEVSGEQDLSPVALVSFYRKLMGNVGNRLAEHVHFGRPENAGREWQRPGEFQDPAAAKVDFLGAVYGDKQARPLPTFESLDADGNPIEPPGWGPSKEPPQAGYLPPHVRGGSTPWSRRPGPGGSGDGPASPNR